MWTTVIRDEVWQLPDWVEVPDDKTAHCRSCQREILWVTTRKGRKAPLDRDGVNHFATCPQAASWRK